MMKDEVSIQYRMPDTTHKKLKYISQKKVRSLNSQIEYFCLKGIEDFEAKYGEIEISEEEESDEA